ncbi:MAG: efflux RND transporter periplasmic adaptor subunit [Gammaproteobacteria bacterium]|nr:MAG: efflux RND transporter periplasmic adaptor subunit [Gammaproteobacteria bacterium]
MKQKIGSLITSKLLPLTIIVFAIIIAFMLRISGNQFSPVSVDAVLPQVKIMVVEPSTIKVPIHSQGVVIPKTEIRLAPEVSGKVMKVSPKLSSGTFFKKGDILFEIDPTNYELEVTRARAAVAKAKLSLTHAKSRGAKALIAEAKSSYYATIAGLNMAKEQVAKTKIKAPFDGVVKDTNIGFGQVVAYGAPVATIYATDMAEVRLPLTDVQLGLIDIPTENTTLEEQPDVELSAIYAGKKYSWQGKIVRFESSIDQRNRLQYVVAQVDEPFKTDPQDPKRPMLVSGLFVRSKINGKQLENVISVPRIALRNGNTVLTVDKSYRLKIKMVNIVYRGKDQVFIDEGLEAFDKVIVTPLNVVVDGMKVQVSGRSE